MTENSAPGRLETKSFCGLEIKDADKGQVTAVIATLNVVDKDGDVILPGAIPNGSKVKISEYDHSIIEDGSPPVGKGQLYEKADKVIVDGEFFMETTRGRESFLTVKAMGQDSEWSIGFLKRVQTAPMTDEWRAQGAQRLIKKMVPIECSPVLIGAGVDTYTISTKAAEDEGAAEREAERVAAVELEQKQAREFAEFRKKRDEELAAEEFERFERTRRRHAIL